MYAYILVHTLYIDTHMYSACTHIYTHLYTYIHDIWRVNSEIRNFKSGQTKHSYLDNNLKMRTPGFVGKNMLNLFMCRKIEGSIWLSRHNITLCGVALAP